MDHLVLTENLKENENGKDWNAKQRREKKKGGDLEVLIAP